MASKDSIAARRKSATERINASIRALAEKQGRDYPPLRATGRDPALTHANQLTALADILEAVVKGGQ